MPSLMLMRKVGEVVVVGAATRVTVTHVRNRKAAVLEIAEPGKTYDVKLDVGEKHAIADPEGAVVELGAAERGFARLTFEAPPQVSIDREEVRRAKQERNAR